MPMTAHFIGGCAIGTSPRDRRRRPLPAGLRLPRPARRRRLGDLGQPRREPVADDHRPGRAGDGVLAQQGRGRPAAGPRVGVRAGRARSAPHHPAVPASAPGALRLPIVARQLRRVPERPGLSPGYGSMRPSTGSAAHACAPDCKARPAVRRDSCLRIARRPRSGRQGQGSSPVRQRTSQGPTGEGGRPGPGESAAGEPVRDPAWEGALAPDLPIQRGPPEAGYARPGDNLHGQSLAALAATIRKAPLKGSAL